MNAACAEMGQNSSLCSGVSHWPHSNTHLQEQVIPRMFTQHLGPFPAITSIYWMWPDTPTSYASAQRYGKSKNAQMLLHEAQCDFWLVLVMMLMMMMLLRAVLTLIRWSSCWAALSAGPWCPSPGAPPVCPSPSPPWRPASGSLVWTAAAMQNRENKKQEGGQEVTNHDRDG